MHQEPTRHDALCSLPSAGTNRFGAATPEGGLTGGALTGPLPLRLAGPAGSTSPSPASFDLITQQFRQLADANEALRDELSRCYSRLNVVLEISENFSSLESPAEIEAALLSRYAATLEAGALLLDSAQGCTSVALGDTGAQSLVPAVSRIRAALAPEIDTVRRTRRTCRVNLPQAKQRGLGDIHVLLGALHEHPDQPHVVIALRSGQQRPFDDNDQLASETVLIYGGHILGSALMFQRLQQASLETVGALANAIEARDNYTRGHSDRVSRLAVLTGKALGLPADELQMLEWAGLLHDVGKIGIPEHILNKPGELEPAEFEQIMGHPQLGYDVLRPVSSLKPVLHAVLYHHENHDGSGYPEGLRGDQIPLLARILHVVDIFDALTSSRSYRAGLSVDEALKVLAEGNARITEPAATMAFMTAYQRHMQTQAEDFNPCCTQV